MFKFKFVPVVAPVFIAFVAYAGALNPAWAQNQQGSTKQTFKLLVGEEAFANGLVLQCTKDGKAFILPKSGDHWTAWPLKIGQRYVNPQDGAVYVCINVKSNK